MNTLNLGNYDPQTPVYRRIRGASEAHQRRIESAATGRSGDDWVVSPAPDEEDDDPSPSSRVESLVKRPPLTLFRDITICPPQNDTYIFRLFSNVFEKHI